MQLNDFDCGLYMLQYIEAFFDRPVKDFTKDSNRMLKTWFPTPDVESKREGIYKFIREYVKKNFPENLEYIPERQIKKGIPSVTLGLFYSIFGNQAPR